eukprot:8895580-Ditylum_brightwellii.AAC.1
MSKRILVIYLPQIEVDVAKDSNLGDEWITRTASDAVGKMQPVKVSAIQIFHNFDELACPYSNLPKGMKGAKIKKIPSADNVLPPNDDGLWAKSPMRSSDSMLRHITSLMGLWSDTLAYQFSSATGLSDLMQKRNDIPNNRGFKSHKSGALQVVTLLEECNKGEPFIINIEQHLNMVKKSNISAWLKDHPNWVDPEVTPPPMVDKVQHDAACARSITSAQYSLVATLSTSPDGRVACHKIWGVVWDTSGKSPQI